MRVRRQRQMCIRDSLSIGNLLVYYTKMELRGEIVEVLKITNVKMLNNTIGEQVIDFIQ